MSNEPSIDMAISELAEIVEDDKRHENTQLALKVNDGNKRLKRIIDFNKLVEQLRKDQQQQEAPKQRQKYVVKQPKMATPEQIKQAQKRPIMTPERERELDKKVEKAVSDDAEDYGLPPLEEQEFYKEENEN